jgi:NACalpha-BTF3-like transcription factor
MGILGFGTNLEKNLSRAGIRNKQLKAKSARIELEEGEPLIFENPLVVRIEMKGQVSYQIYEQPKGSV